MNESGRHFAVCIRNEGHEESLELRKIYEVLPDATAEAHDMVRVIDEEGEDYLYPGPWFLPIDLPKNIEEHMARHAPDQVTAAINQAVDEIGDQRDDFVEAAARRVLAKTEWQSRRAR